MTNDPEEFEQLQKLLKLKRYEQPPPRYFTDFSSQVISRLEVQAAAGPAERLWGQTSWIWRLVHVLEGNSMAAGGFAAAVCALLVGGIVYSEYPESAAAEFAGDSGGTQLFVKNTPGSSLWERPATGRLVSSTNAFVPKLTGSFLGSPGLVQPAVFGLGGQ